MATSVPPFTTHEPITSVRSRRILFAFLVVATMAGLATAMATLLSVNGWNLPKIAMFAGFLVSLPWTVIGFWNALIGLMLTWLAGDPAALVNPCLRRARPADALQGRTALAICVRHENAVMVERRIAIMRASLDAAGAGSHFDFFLLSDSSRPEIIAAEEAAIARLRDSDSRPDRLIYRRRQSNAGFKAGNVREFLDQWADDYDYFIPLDADSLMTGPAMVRLVQIMQANPSLGILQSLVVGLPSTNFFTRLFQFGMRHGMRSYTMGSAWWQGDCGPFWGHNAIIRSRLFRDHCGLPVLPGKPPLGGYILSHDQVEAVLMRRAGYDVRVLVEESGSFEENPPSLPDFIKRDLRWCQGNMQYWWLLGMRGLRFLSRIQLSLAILMYLAAPGWIMFILAGTAQLFVPYGPESPPEGLGIALFLTLLLMGLAPKIAGLADVIADRERYASYGHGRIFAGAWVEFAFSTLLAPCMSLIETVFMIGLLFGRQVKWEVQNRDAAGLTWKQAVQGLWLQTLFGIGLAVLLAIRAPAILPWASPLILATAGAVPFAMFMASPALGVWATRMGLCAIPEERITPWEVAALTQVAAMPVAAGPLPARA